MIGHFPMSLSAAEECNEKKRFTSWSKRQAWIFSAATTTNNSWQTLSEVFQNSSAQGLYW